MTNQSIDNVAFALTNGDIVFDEPIPSITMSPDDYHNLQRYQLEAEGLRLVANHIKDVQFYMAQIIHYLTTAARIHDSSKYSPQEIGLVIKKAQLDAIPYMSEEYKAALANVQDGLQHHYQMNPHHPEFWTNGVEDMSMLNLLELLADWKAASDATVGGSLDNSIEKNTERFNLSPEMVRLLTNTARDLGWI